MTVYRGLGPSGLCYLLPYFSVKHCPTLFSAVSLRAWKLSCSQVFQPLTLPRVCSEQKVWVQFSKVNLFFKYFNPIIWSFNKIGWFILSLFKIRLVRTEKLKMYGTLFHSHKAIHECVFSKFCNIPLSLQNFTTNLLYLHFLLQYKHAADVWSFFKKDGHCQEACIPWKVTDTYMLVTQTIF